MNRKKACDIFLEYNNKIKVSIKNLNILLQMNISQKNFLFKGILI